MDMIEKAASLRRVVDYGLTNGKRNLIVDLDVLDALFRGLVPVGGNELPPEDVTARLYEVKAERDKLRTAVAFALRTLGLHREPDANPLAMAADAARAEKMMRESLILQPAEADAVIEVCRNVR